MAKNTHSTGSTGSGQANPYAGKSRAELEKELSKLEREYQESLAKGKMNAMVTPSIRKERARLLSALNNL